jgi:hypothetical protein
MFIEFKMIWAKIRLLKTEQEESWDTLLLYDGDDEGIEPEPGYILLRTQLRSRFLYF